MLNLFFFADNDAMATLSHTEPSDVTVIDDKGDTEYFKLWIRIEGIPLLQSSK